MARILIVDDSAIMRKNLIFIFNNNGHEVVGEAINGKQAITLYGELKPDLVTMDISMPLMNGVNAVKTIIDMDANAKIIMISALNQKQMVFEALNNGAKHYIIKPIEANKVIGIVNEVLEEKAEEIIEVKTQAEEVTKADPSTVQGFKVENNNGKFIFSFNNSVGLKDYLPIETAIKGLLFIKPLSIVFDFSEVLKVPDDIVNLSKKLKKSVKEAGGSFTYEVKDKTLKNILELD